MVHQQNYILYEKLVLSKHLPLKIMFMEEYHSTPTGGHSGLAKMYSNLRANVNWDGMRKDISYFIANSKMCQQTK